MTSERNTHMASMGEEDRMAERGMTFTDGRRPDEGRTLEEIISDVAEQELAQYPPVFMTPEKLEAMAADRKAARKKRRYRLVGGIAAMLALVLMGAVIAFNAFSVDVGADKNRKEEIETEDGVVIEDGGYGASSEDNIVLTEWEDVLAEKDINPQLIIPEYIPEGYEFDELTIETLVSGDMVSEYFYINNKNEMLEIEIFMSSKTLVALDIDNVSRTIESNRGLIYLQEINNKIATIQIDDGITITIWSDLSDKEIIKIIECLSN